MPYTFKPQKGLSLREKVITDIRNAILNGNLKPGDKLKEVELSEQMNVSRGPIREAFIQLEREGIIINKPYRETIVADINIDEVRNVVIPIRFHLEWYVIKKYINQMDDDFLNELQSIVNEMNNISDSELNKIAELDISFHQKIINLSTDRMVTSTWDNMLTPIRLHFIKNRIAYDKNLIQRDHQLLLNTLKTKNINIIYNEFLKHIKGDESFLGFK